MYKSFSMELAGRTLTVDVGRVAAQANGAAFMHYGDTTVLSTATASDKPRDGIDFFPLSVEFEEKMYSVGKIPGGFNKREGKASENAVLTARVIDRPMRPLFPKDYRNDVTLNNLVLSVDQDCSPEYTAMLGSAIATCISDIPFDGPCAMTQIGMIDGEFIINPSQAQWKQGDLNLTVASTREKVIMIEAGANEIPEAKMIEAIYKAHEVNQEIIKFIDTIVAECGKAKHSYESCAIPEELFAAIREIVTPEQMEEAVFTDDKQTREENIRQITEKLEEAFALYEKWGVKGLMVDFLDRDDQEMIRIQEEILQAAARHRLFIQFHGSSKPSGLTRTYPNEFTREGTLNYEVCKWDTLVNADHDISVPFTRLLAGPTDYHLGGFRALPRSEFKIQYVNPYVMSTRCHMMAMYVVLENHLTSLCDTPMAYEGQPGFEVLRTVPGTWDEMHVPLAEFNKYVTVARRNGTDWWVGTLNDGTARTLNLKLDFLGEGEYRAEIYTDAPDAEKNPNHLSKEIRTVTRKDKIELPLAVDGGAVLRISKL